MRAVLAQARVELALTLRRGESVLLSIGIPVLLLAFFSTVGPDRWSATLNGSISLPYCTPDGQALSQARQSRQSSR